MRVDESDILENLSLAELKQALRDTMHEVREFNRIVKANSEMLTRQLRIEEDGPLQLSVDNARNVRNHAIAILETAQMLSARLDLIDLETNPDSFTSEQRISLGVFAKFDKARKMLRTKGREKRVEVEFSGQSFNKSDLYPVFDIVPFLLLENAIKYSPKESKVVVTFSERPQFIDVLIESLGPLVKGDERSKLTEKNFRGECAKALGIPGTGFGLHFAKFVCDLNQIDLEISPSASSYSVNGVPHAPFKVTLRVPRGHI
ncbi:hypothetical protein ACODUL_03025 [Stenotrophomonas maltophilia]|uniref:hypothetical protein n=1 Tax=Stenotrophomonas cyclobalanopsidis TaxID=2771362 RepID=UPI00345F8FF1